MNKFVRGLLRDVQALEFMLENNWFESDITRIGAEQEMIMVDNKSFKPAPIAMEVLDLMKDHPWVETEIARFNLETNMVPRKLEGDCFSAMDKENTDNLNTIQSYLDTMNTSLVLTGILPTLRKHHLRLDNLTPKKRYKALIDAINDQLIGSSFELRLKGIDELLLKHDSPLLEACNTSFQVHLQVAPDDFVQYYNIAQVLCAPVMAIAANSPLVFGKRLWHESRIALFQQALDTRTSHEYIKDRNPRVNFGNQWLKESVLEIYKEDIARFRVLISSDIEEDSIDAIQAGKVPKLRSLQVHNSTVYRWNRPCYGISANGKPHLRIENRVLPSGPTVIDEMANAAFWLGLMKGMANEVKDVRELIGFDDAKDNFLKAAKFGIDSSFSWLNDKKISACDLVKNELIPLAEAGLEANNVDKKDIDKYIQVIYNRANTHKNGARWLLRGYSNLKVRAGNDEALAVLTASMLKNQRQNIPVSEWKEPELIDLEHYAPDHLIVSEFMETDIITVQQNDLIELVAEMMDWNKVRYMPVEDKKGKLIGLVTLRSILREYVREEIDPRKIKTVKDIMIKNPISINPNASIQEAISIMRENGIGCLPVTENKELLGIIIEKNFMQITSRLLSK
jgi:CBS domain-containing protein